MIRGLGLILIPLLLPTLIFLAYSAFMHWRDVQHGGQPAEPWWERPPYLALLGVGVVLMAAVLMGWAAFHRLSPETQYEAPRYEDGEIVRPWEDEEGG